VQTLRGRGARQQALSRLAREHAALLAVLAAGVLLRLAVALAYRPGLLSVDSWGYLDLALRADPVGFAPERPSGYPLLLNVLDLPGRSIAAVTTVQHLAGLATGVLAYFLLLRLGVRKGIAAAAAAVLLLDSYAVALEQHLLTEAFFGLALLGAAYLAIESRGALGLALSGALIGLAVTLRTAGLFAIPVWLLYLAWSRRSVRPAAAGVASLLVVLCGYAGLHAAGDPSRDANPNTFSLSEMDGWFLYAKTAAIADCAGADIPARARPLCQPAEERSRDADFYLFNTASPAKQLVGHGRSGERQVEDNRMLRQFALAIIRDHPWAYAEMVARDSAAIFTPGGRGVDVTVRLPRGGEELAGGGRAPRPCAECDGVDVEPVNAGVRDRYEPGYEPRVHWPSGLVVAYQDWLHTPRWLMAALALVVALCAALSLTPLRKRLPHRRETFFLGGMAIAVVVGSAAVANPSVRFLVPMAPLLVCGGVAGAVDLIYSRRGPA
jgi:hypothetical protein